MTSGKDEEAILVLKVRPATDLPQYLKARPYVMARIDSGVSNPYSVKTSIDEKWDFVIPFPLNQEMIRMSKNFRLICQIMNSGTAFEDREILCVTVPLQELLAVAGSAAGEYYQTYPLVSGEEERGRIVISHKLVGNIPAPPSMGIPYSLPQFQDRTLELFLHYGCKLPRPSYPSKGRLYVKAAIVHPNTKPNWDKTDTDDNGGENPVWNFMFRFPLNQEMLLMSTNFNLVCEIMRSGKILGGKIGHVKVRLQDLLAEAATGENIHYPVEVSGGRKKGEIVISHKLLPNTAGISAPPPVGVQDPNHGAEPNAVVDGIATASRVTTAIAALGNFAVNLA